MKETKLNTLLSRLLASAAEGQEETFAAVCLHFGDQDIELIYDLLTKSSNAQSVYWLVRYFVAIERPLGFDKLVALSQNQSLAVRKEACSGIAKISKDWQETLLPKILESSYDDVAVFAIKQLGELGRVSGAVPLLNAFDRLQRDTKAVVSIIRSMRKIQDVRFLPILERLASKSSGKIQEEALACLGAYAYKLHSKYLKRYLHSANPKIRAIAYIAVLRFVDKRWEKYIERALLGEKEESLKLTVLRSMNTIQTRSLFGVVFEMALRPPSSKIGMMARSAVKRSRSRPVFKWLIKKERNSSGDSKMLALRLLSEYGGLPETFHELRRVFTRSS
ncbi:MAG: hypothetical protein PHP46_06115, partial [Candidatus Omnitrophica bacterium]|nr:hypothetical protein [Candidatus Omnitrophota bacterium]